VLFEYIQMRVIEAWLALRVWYLLVYIILLRTTWAVRSKNGVGAALEGD
jgi:hypothetical protein